MLSRCKYPKVIRCKDGVERAVPCGHCSACRSVVSFGWQKRLESEMQSSRYTLFFTLTYDNQHLPTIVVDAKTHTFQYCQYEVNPVDDFFLSDDVMSDIKLHYTLRSGKYIIPIFLHYDLIEFTRKLKTLINDARYYIQTEYGPTTLRPHAHGLLFFSSVSPDLAKDFICQTWQKCDWSIHSQHIQLAYSASYVTSYVSSVVELPKILQYKRFAPFSHKSVSPPIGSKNYSLSSLAAFRLADTVRTSYADYRTLEFVEVPYLKFHENRYFPKLPYDSQLSCESRSFLYKSYDYFRYQFAKGSERAYTYSFYEAVFNRLYDVSPVFHDWVAPLLTSESSIYRIYLASRSFCKNWQSAPALFRDFVIDEHFYKMEMYKLRLQYQYEEEFCRSHEPKFLIFKDLKFVEDYSSLFGSCPAWVLFTIKGYGYTSIEDFSSTSWRYDLKHNPDQRKYFSTIDSILSESHKSKSNNSYLAAHNHPLYLDRGL